MVKSQAEKASDKFLLEKFGLNTADFKAELAIGSLKNLSNNPKDNITLTAFKNGESYKTTYTEPQLRALLEVNGVSF